MNEKYQYQQKRRQLNQGQNNRSALMLAGENSLKVNMNNMNKSKYYNDNDNNYYNQNQDNNFKPTESNVISIYKNQNRGQQKTNKINSVNHNSHNNDIYKPNQLNNTNKANKLYDKTDQSQFSTPNYLDLNSKMKSIQIDNNQKNQKNQASNNLKNNYSQNVNAKSRYYTEENRDRDNTYNYNYKQNGNIYKNNEEYGNYGKEQSSEQFTNTKKIMMKLTLPRLRKMQALVRGFLVRRIVYPQVLEEYLIAESVLRLIQANVIYKESSAILLQTITFPKYEGGLRDFIGDQQMLENSLYDKIVQRVIQKQLPQIVQDSIIQKGALMSRPQITFGLNLRSPVQLLLYQKLMQQINRQLKQICQESIKEEAAQKRELLIIDEWITKYQMVNSLYKEIVDECLEQNVGQYVVQSILERINREACYVVSQNTYNKTVSDWYNQQMDSLAQQVQELLFQELVSGVVIQNKQKHSQK